MHDQWKHEAAVHFITTTTRDRREIFRNPVACRLLRDELFFYAKQYDVNLLACVIMPNHVHALIFPNGTKTFSDYVRGVKGHFARMYTAAQRRGAGTPPITEETNRPVRGDTDAPNPTATDIHATVIGGVPAPRPAVVEIVWQESFFDYLIFSRQKLQEKIDYIIQNPVEEGLAAHPMDYPWLFVDERKTGEYLSW